jgi:hypothetical protein
LAYDTEFIINYKLLILDPVKMEGKKYENALEGLREVKKLLSYIFIVHSTLLLLLILLNIKSLANTMLKMLPLTHF